ncbi:putative gpi anchored protein [Scedosporium apiospermum]|uniref:Putative gpi anchored protein n=1 Tax=Pseudallescheria apiosperma TaxID=563466 RepID=A0A084GDL6_PSEDA|nr:putative gpi anchored protein [Scedosporium apiospermum]KEZ45428.1 putative gpi anchored protein [Scedosporium apiospermum]
MARLTTTLLSLLATTTTAHFTISYPPFVEPANENLLASGPCGGAELDFEKGTVTDFHVGGDAVAVIGGHPQSNWLFRVTDDITGATNWTKAFPIVQQNGAGKFCEPQVTVPEAWIGRQGLLGVVANAEDGVLYACSQVKFVEGAAGQPPSECQNTTKTASFVDDSTLDALVGDGSSSSGNSSSGSGDSGSGSGSGDGSGSGSGGASGSGDEGGAAALASSFFGVLSAAAVVAGVFVL